MHSHAFKVGKLQGRHCLDHGTLYYPKGPVRAPVWHQVPKTIACMVSELLFHKGTVSRRPGLFGRAWHLEDFTVWALAWQGGTARSENHLCQNHMLICMGLRVKDLWCRAARMNCRQPFASRAHASLWPLAEYAIARATGCCTLKMILRWRMHVLQLQLLNSSALRWTPMRDLHTNF